MNVEANKNTSTGHERIVALIRSALSLANVSVYLGLTAMVCVCVFGTLASLPAFKDNMFIYAAFHYLPYLFVALSIPISLYHAFILGRYHIIQIGVLKMILSVGFGSLFFALAMWLKGWVMAFYMSLFLAMIAWFAMPFLFRVNLGKFLTFLENKNNSNND